MYAVTVTDWTIGNLPIESMFVFASYGAARDFIDDDDDRVHSYVSQTVIAVHNIYYAPGCEDSVKLHGKWMDEDSTF